MCNDSIYSIKFHCLKATNRASKEKEKKDAISILTL